MTSDLVELAESAKRRLEAQAAAEQKEAQRQRTAEEVYSDLVKQQESHVLEHAKFIIQWARDFAKSEEGRKVLSVIEGASLFSGPSFMDDGRKADEGFYWSLRLKKDGTLIWRHQMKWMGRQDVIVRKPKDMLMEGLSPRNVEGARRALESEEFRQRIRKQLERVGRPST